MRTNGRATQLGEERAVAGVQFVDDACAFGSESRERNEEILALQDVQDESVLRGNGVPAEVGPLVWRE